MRIGPAIALVGLIALAAPLVAGEEKTPDLAARCEAVKWEHPTGDSSGLIPAGLRPIADELRARGPSALDDIEAALPKSRNLRRLVSSVADGWPCDRSRKLLVGLLGDADEMTVYLAVDALADLRGAEVVEPLLGAARKRGGMTRHNVLNALDDLGALPKGLDVALAATEDREPWVRHSAYACLSSVDWEPAVGQALAKLETAHAREKDADAKAAAAAAIRVLQARR